MKKVCCMAALCILVLALSTGCARGGDEESALSPSDSVPPAAPDDSSGSQEDLPDTDDPADTEVSVDRILMEIEAAYGEEYPAKGVIPIEILQAQYGLEPEMYLDAKGAMPMVSIHNDQVVVVQAASGRADDVEQALEQARRNKIADTMQYPTNIPKTNAAKVVRHDDFVAFLLIGVPDDTIEDPQSEEARVYAEQQVQIAVDAFYSVFA